MNWFDDLLFQPQDCNSLDELGGIATPAFRVSAQGSLLEGHPFDHVAAYERLFQVFKPVLERRAERLTVNEKPGAKKRRRTSITDADWTPVQSLKDVVPGDERNYIGFDFKSGRTVRVHDRGPTGFRLRIARSVQLDATISVPDFASGALDLEELKAAMLGLPLRTALAGYGMGTSSYFDGHEPHYLLLPVAKRYPAIDLCPSPLRSWFADRDDDFRFTWISGVNWLTLVGEPFLSALGGADALLDGLPSAIESRTSDTAVLFQLGARPITGQTGEDDALLPLYHALGRRLQPLGEGCPSARHPRGSVFAFERDQSLLWERRFYDGRWFEEPDR